MSLDILHLHQADWRAAVGAGDFQRGVGYAEQGRSRLLDRHNLAIPSHTR